MMARVAAWGTGLLATLAVPEGAKPDDPPDGGNDPGASPVIAAAKGRRG